jgi:hypothetical protein
MKAPMEGAVTIVNDSLRRPTVKRDSNHAPTGIIRNVGACAAASSGPYRPVPSSSAATSSLRGSRPRTRHLYRIILQARPDLGASLTRTTGR